MKGATPVVSLLGLFFFLVEPGGARGGSLASRAAQPPTAACEGLWDGGGGSCTDRRGDCGPLDCGDLGGCCPAGSYYWASAEYLLWWTKGRHLPPLATTSPSGTARDVAGRIGLDGTTVLYGDEEVGGDVQSGGRLTIGAWLDDCREAAVGGDFFFLEGEDAGFAAESVDGSRTLARPFWNMNPLPPFTVTPDANLISYTDPQRGPLVAGSLRVDSELDVLGADAFARVLLQAGCGYRVDLVGGYHFSRIDDSLRINAQWDVLDPEDPLAGTTIGVRDHFDVENQFHGGGVGLLTEVRHCAWTLDALAKISVGNMRQTAEIRGSTVQTQPPAGPGQPAPQGLLALNSNSGRFQRNRTALLPEVRVTLGYRVTPCWDLTLGYSLLYWSHVALAGDQADPTLNLSQVTGPLIGPARPAFRFRDTDFWVQGVQLGASCSF